MKGGAKGKSLSQGLAFEKHVRVQTNVFAEYSDCLSYSSDLRDTIVDLYGKVFAVESSQRRQKITLDEVERTCNRLSPLEDRIARLEKNSILSKNSVQELTKNYEAKISALQDTVKGLEGSSISRLYSLTAAYNATHKHVFDSSDMPPAELINKFKVPFSTLIPTLQAYEKGIPLDAMFFGVQSGFEQKQQVVAEAMDTLMCKQKLLLEQARDHDLHADSILEDRDRARLELHNALQVLIKDYEGSETLLWQHYMEARQLDRKLAASLAPSEGPRSSTVTSNMTEAHDVIATSLVAMKSWWENRSRKQQILRQETDAAATSLASALCNVVALSWDIHCSAEGNKAPAINELADSLEQAIKTEVAYFRGTISLEDFPKKDFLGAAAVLQGRCLESIMATERLRDQLPNLRDRRAHLEPHLHQKPDVISELQDGIQKVKGLAKQLNQMKARMEEARIDDDDILYGDIKAEMHPVKKALRIADRAMRNATARASQLKEEHFPELQLPLKAMPVQLAGIISNCKDPHQFFDDMTPLEADTEARHNLWLVRCAGEEKVLKEYRLKNQQAGLAFQKELRTLVRLAHPTIITVETAFYDEHLFSAYVQMPKFPSNLEVLLRSAPSSHHMSVVVRGLLSAVQHVHSCGVVHGDLKPPNVLLTEDGVPVLTDFDFSCNAEKGTVSSSLVPRGGTADFIAPELQEGARPTKASDIFAIGVMFSQAADRLEGTEVGTFVVQASTQMKQVEPSKRPTVSELVAQAAQHFDHDQAQAATEALAVQTERQQLRLRRDEIENEWAELTRKEEDVRLAGLQQDEKIAQAQRALLAERQRLANREQQLETELPPPPPYWITKSLEVASIGKYATNYPQLIIQDILRKTMFLSSPSDPCTCCGTPPPIPEVVGVTRIENMLLWKSYCRRRREILERHQIDQHTIERLSPEVRPEHGKLLTLDAATNEVLLLHGVSGGRSVADTICEQGFDERVSKLRCLYGCGIYTAEQACKIMQYAKQDTYGLRYAFYSRVTLGRVKYTTTNLTGERRPPKGYDSVVANTGVANSGKQHHREFVIYDRNQIYPEFLVCFKA